ncbi:flavin reductase family protein [Paraburkholderia dipogonis]|uniref:flavin reductase family protein n=1 Tax=Paraburkholderia dipogonis TaxID=1211383 RepID=UPI0038BA84D8
MNFVEERQQASSAYFDGKRDDTLDVAYITRRELPLIDASLAHIVARTAAIHEAGDRLLYIGHIQHLQLGEQRKILVFYCGKV